MSTPQGGRLNMPIFQAFNSRMGAWVKYHFTREGFQVVDVKQQQPRVPFKGTKIRGKRR